MDTAEQIKILKKLRENSVHKKYIEYIRFPKFRNLVEDSRIDFDFPITFLVGKNGGGKSSTLQSLYGCPQGYSLGDYWFTTELDPIKEFETDRNCFIYGYKVNNDIVEVLKQRSFREGNPDYWEPSKPVRKYSMSNKRVSPITKNVEYIDFRSELSAFDKYMHFSTFSPGSRFKNKQDFLRFYTRKLKTALDINTIINIRGFNRNRRKILLNPESIEIINHILGKSYKEIEIIEHSLFKDWGFSIRLKSPELHYSEAFAGSGETAIVMLVYKILNAEEESLILLDEPETSLHSGAQKRLLSFILEICKERKHQFVISTHSPFLIEEMPENSIKVFSTIKSTGRFLINPKRHFKEAFHELEINNEGKKNILVEDKFAKLILEATLQELGEATKNLFEVKYLPGGASDINQRITTLMEFPLKTYIVFDGDQKRLEKPIDLNSVPVNEQNTVFKLKAFIKSQTNCDIKFHLDSPGKEGHEDQEKELCKTYLDYYKEKVFYFPLSVPEDIIWDEDFASRRLKLSSPNLDISDIINGSKDSKEKLFKLCIEIFADSKQIESIYLEFIKNWLAKKDENLVEIQGIINSIK